MRNVRSSFVTLALVLALVAAAFAAKDFVMPKPSPASQYPAHDAHPAEKVTIAVDPYDMADKAAIFRGEYLENELMPMFLVITNDGDQPVSLASMKMQLVTRDRAKASPATEDDLYRRLTKTEKIQDDARGAKRIPLPLPQKPKRAVSKQVSEEIDAAQFRARAVEPHGTQAGFVFFDVGDLPNPMAGAHLYITGVQDGNGNELMYFEIPLEKYLTGGSVK